MRLVLSEKPGWPPIAFTRTPEGKPYLLNQSPTEPIGFNITHDNALVGLAFSPGIHNPPAFSIGIDVMKVRTPTNETFATFLASFEEQLTDLEVKQVTTPGVTEDERIRRFFWMWTLKEAYTKALGMGLGFDFKKVEFDVARKQVKVDGIPPNGWRFIMFTICDGEDLYEGVVAERAGDTTEVVDASSGQCGLEWLKVVGAANVLHRAVKDLPTL